MLFTNFALWKVPTRAGCYHFTLVAVLLLTAGANFCFSSTFQNPILGSSMDQTDYGDPWIVYYKGSYYLTVTDGNGLFIRKASSLNGLKSSSQQKIFQPTNQSFFWAPELHFYNGLWYYYYSASDDSTCSYSDHANCLRNYALVSQGDDPLGPYNGPYKVTVPYDNWAIDFTIFQNSDTAAGGDNSLYALWSGQYCTYVCDPNKTSKIFIAKMSDPATITGPAVEIPTNTFGCSHVTSEGPEILQHNGKVYLAYSTCNYADNSYKLGMAVANAGDNLLSGMTWNLFSNPVFQTANGVYGPGHNGFFMSPDGSENWIVYGAHSVDAEYSPRSIRAQKFTFDSSDNPYFGDPVATNVDIPEPAVALNLQGGTQSFQIVNIASGLCVDIDTNNGNKNNVIQWPCDSSNPNQAWKFSSTVNGYGVLINQGANTCLDDPNSSSASGVKLDRANCDGSSGQNWYLVDTTNGSYHLRNQVTDPSGGALLLDASGSKNSGVQMELWGDNSTLSQFWHFIPIQ